uniref:Uncharacterized protein n=1 Tax=Plectus sambesii TaxID=2011161 RepID=A0A914VV45_9BILA
MAPRLEERRNEKETDKGKQQQQRRRWRARGNDDGGGTRPVAAASCRAADPGKKECRKEVVRGCGSIGVRRPRNWVYVVDCACAPVGEGKGRRRRPPSDGGANDREIDDVYGNRAPSTRPRQLVDKSFRRSFSAPRAARRIVRPHCAEQATVPSPPSPRRLSSQSQRRSHSDCIIGQPLFGSF